MANEEQLNQDAPSLEIQIAELQADILELENQQDEIVESGLAASSATVLARIGKELAVLEKKIEQLEQAQKETEKASE